MEPVSIWEDRWLLVCAKPSGMLVHRGWAQAERVLVDWAREHLGQRRVHPVHRIDRGSSGLVMIARDGQVARALQEAMQQDAVEKIYWALVRGQAPLAGHIDHAIPRKQDGPRVAARSDMRRLGCAQTQPRVVSLVEVRPRTGRLHQVRRHLKHINHPLIGDANYGKGKLNRALRERYGLGRLALHARGLQLDHPVSGQTLRFWAPLPDDLRQPLEQMGFAPGLLGRRH